MNGTTIPATAAQSPVALTTAMGMTDAEIAQRKEWLKFTEEDVECVLKVSDFTRRIQDEVINELYAHLLSFEETRQFFKDPQLLERVKALQKEYFIRLTQGNYDREYFENRLKIGAVHARIGLDPK